MKKQRTIGLFVSSTQTLYEVALYKGVCDVANKANTNVICFTSGALRSYRGFESQRNVLFDLVNAGNVDGLIISGTLAHPIPAEEILAFFKRYEGIPKVSIALAMPGTPNVMVDSRSGISGVVKHLIEVHGYKKLAFLRGPIGQQEAEERFGAFCDTLAAYGIALDENLVADGDYSFDSGRAAMQELLGRPDAGYRAIVSANDTMALGAVEVLRAAGKAIPNDVAITGFDDTIEGRFDQVPFTSVRQDIYGQGVIAAHVLLAQMNGESVPEKITAPAPVIIRQSCGCAGFTPPETSLPVKERETWQETLRFHWPEVLMAVQTAMSHIPSERVVVWAAGWLESVIPALEQSNAGIFLRALETSQRNGDDLGIEIAVWHRALAAFFHETQRCLAENQLRHQAANLAQRATLRLGEVAETIEKEHKIELDWRDMALREISETLMTTFNLEGVLDVLSSELPRLNIQACYLSLFEDPQNPANLSRMIFAWREGRRYPIPEGGIPFPSQQLVPDALNETLNSFGLVVEALYSKEDQLGFVIFQVEPRYVSITASLRSQLSGALQGVLLLEQRRKAEEKLLQSQEQLQAMVNKLEYANQELESFAYSVSHDLRAPLRAIIGFSSILEREHHETLSPESRKLFERISQNGKRMGVLIDDLLAFSRVGRLELSRRFVDMNLQIREIWEDFADESSSRQIEWVIAGLPRVFADPMLIRQVWINLLGNAVKYTSKREAARIEVGAFEQEGETIFFVRDNGAGFDMKYSSKLFGVFNRLHHEDEFTGTGIGLAIVHRVITRHGGRIWAEAEVDKGATFFFTLPDG